MWLSPHYMRRSPSSTPPPTSAKLETVWNKLHREAQEQIGGTADTIIGEARERIESLDIPDIKVYDFEDVFQYLVARYPTLKFSSRDISSLCERNGWETYQRNSLLQLPYIPEDTFHAICDFYEREAAGSAPSPSPAETTVLPTAPSGSSSSEKSDAPSNRKIRPNALMGWYRAQRVSSKGARVADKVVVRGLLPLATAHEVMALAASGGIELLNVVPTNFIGTGLILSAQWIVPPLHRWRRGKKGGLAENLEKNFQRTLSRESDKIPPTSSDILSVDQISEMNPAVQNPQFAAKQFAKLTEDAKREEARTNTELTAEARKTLGIARGLRFNPASKEPIAKHEDLESALREKAFLELMARRAHCLPHEVPPLGNLEQYVQFCFERFTATCESLHQSKGIGGLSPADQAVVEFYHLEEKDEQSPTPRQKMNVLEQRWQASRKYAQLLYNEHQKQGFRWSSTITLGSALGLSAATGGTLLAPVAAGVSTLIQWLKNRSEKPEGLKINDKGTVEISYNEMCDLSGGLYDPDRVDAFQPEDAGTLKGTKAKWAEMMKLPDALRDDHSIKSCKALGAAWGMRVLDDLHGQPMPVAEPDTAAVAKATRKLEKAKEHCVAATKEFQTLKLKQKRILQINSMLNENPPPSNDLKIQLTTERNGILEEFFESDETTMVGKVTTATSNKDNAETDLRTAEEELEKIENPGKGDLFDKEKSFVLQDENAGEAEAKKAAIEANKKAKALNNTLKDIFAIRVNQAWATMQQRRRDASWFKEGSVPRKAAQIGGIVAGVPVAAGTALGAMAWGANAFLFGAPIIPSGASFAVGAVGGGVVALYLSVKALFAKGGDMLINSVKNVATAKKSEHKSEAKKDEKKA